MSEAVISIGTNMGERFENIKNAVRALALLPDTNLIKVSGVYETTPVGFENQDNFLNICLLIGTNLSPLTLLGGIGRTSCVFLRARDTAKSDKGASVTSSGRG